MKVEPPVKKRSAQKDRPRRPGRPKADTGDQRLRLLDSAATLFGQHGIAATSIAAIARDAKVTPALVHYYFGSRDALVEERIRPLIDTATATPDLASGDPRTLLHAFVTTFATLMMAHPWLPPLYVREVLSEGGQLRERIIGGIAMPVAKRLAAALAGARKQKRLPSDLDPRLLVVSVMALVLFPLAAMPIWKRVFNVSTLRPRQLIDHTLALIDHGIALP